MYKTTLPSKSRKFYLFVISLILLLITIFYIILSYKQFKYNEYLSMNLTFNINLINIYFKLLVIFISINFIINLILACYLLYIYIYDFNINYYILYIYFIMISSIYIIFSFIYLYNTNKNISNNNNLHDLIDVLNLSESKDIHKINSWFIISTFTLSICIIIFILFLMDIYNKINI